MIPFVEHARWDTVESLSIKTSNMGITGEGLGHEWQVLDQLLQEHMVRDGGLG